MTTYFTVFLQALSIKKSVGFYLVLWTCQFVSETHKYAIFHEKERKMILCHQQLKKDNSTNLFRLSDWLLRIKKDNSIYKTCSTFQNNLIVEFYYSQICLWCFLSLLKVKRMWLYSELYPYTYWYIMLINFPD
jgi:hypothetical protein